MRWLSRQGAGLAPLRIAATAAFVVALVLPGVLPVFAETPLQRASTLFAQRSWSEARKVLQPIARGNAEALTLLGRAELELGLLSVAVESLESATKVNARSSAAWYWLGYAQGLQAIEANPLRQAVLAKRVQKSFETAVTLDPANLEARKGLISFYLMAPSIMGGSVEKAKKQAAEIMKRDRVEGHIANARFHRHDKKWDAIEVEYAAAVKAAPQDRRGHYWLGMHLMYMEKYPRAFEELEKAIAIDPAFMPSWFYLGRTSAISGQNLPRGEEALRRYLAFKPTREEPGLAGAHYWLGTIYEKTNRRDQARSAYLAAKKLAPKSKEVDEALARVK